MILFLTKDLFFIPVLQSAGKKQAAEVVAVLSLDSPKATQLDAAQITACVIDLTAVDVAEMGPVVARLRETFAAAQIAAFGPHVQEGRLATARTAGCDQVLTRGQLNSQIDQLMANWATPRA